MVADLIVILEPPLNDTPLIVLGFSKNVAEVEFPTKLPLNFLKLESVTPDSTSVNPPTEFDAAIVNALAEQIPITELSIVNKITGFVVPSVSSNVVVLALVMPYPAAASGPINVHPVSVQMCNVLSVVRNHSTPTEGLSGGNIDNTAAPTMAHFEPS